MASQQVCPFCATETAQAVLENELAFAIYDQFPVTPGHALIIPKRHVSSFFETTTEEKIALLDLSTKLRAKLLEERSPDGFNLGINDGPAAGQTVMHLHLHLIPRYAGDTEDPRGGVRWIMPVKAPYWKNRD